MAVFETDRVCRFAGWSAYVSAGLSIIGGIALFLFYGLEAPRSIATGSASQQFFGPLSDYAGLFQFLSMLPLAVAIHQLTTARNQLLSLAAAALGIVGLLTTLVAQTLLVAHLITFEVNLPMVLVGMVFIGLWMVIANGLGRTNGALTSRLAWLGEFAGAMFALLGGLTFLFVVVNAINPAAMANLATSLLNNPVLTGAIVVLFTPALLAYVIGVPVWLIGVGRRLLVSDAAALAARDKQVSLSR